MLKKLELNELKLRIAFERRMHNRRNRYSSAFRSKNLNLFVQRKELLTLLVFFVKFKKKWCKRYLIDLREFQAAKKIQYCFIRIRRRHFWRRLSSFFVICTRVQWRFQLAVRIFKKKRAVDILRFVLEQGNRLSSGKKIISRYLLSIRKAQNLVRSYFVCKSVKQKILRKIWARQSKIFEEDVRRKVRKMKQMKPIALRGRTMSQLNTSKNCKEAIKKVNKGIGQWRGINEKIEILSSQKKYNAKESPSITRSIQNNVFIEPISKNVRESVLTLIMKEIQNSYINDLGKFRIRRLPTMKFSANDVLVRFNLHDSKSGVRRDFYYDRRSDNKSVPPYLFWTRMRKGRKSVDERIQIVLTDTYRRLYGDPLTSLTESSHQKSSFPKRSSIRTRVHQ